MLFHVLLLLVHFRYVGVLNPFTQVLNSRLEKGIENRISAQYRNLQEISMLRHHRYWLGREEISIKESAPCIVIIFIETRTLDDLLEEAIVLTSYELISFLYFGHHRKE